jgi:hypothetical protein
MFPAVPKKFLGPHANMTGKQKPITITEAWMYRLKDEAWSSVKEGFWGSFILAP